MAGLKTTSYAENVVALAEAHRRGADEAVVANLAGHLCEGTGSNVFYVVDGELRTPRWPAVVSPGSRGRWCWSGSAAGRWTSRSTSCAGPARCFLVSTTRDVQPVVRWDDVDLPAPGPVTRAAQAAWRERETSMLEEARTPGRLSRRDARETDPDGPRCVGRRGMGYRFRRITAGDWRQW